MRYVRISLSGIVQGVGMRPFIYRTAKRHRIRGWVSNNPQGVLVMAAGEPESIERFIQAIGREAPPQARVEEVRVEEVAPFQPVDFSISVSGEGGEQSVLVSPDLATCPDCLRELFDPRDRRYRYPFINCTACGPRFTIIARTPYDRPNTSMARFSMCDECEREYHDPSDRRFHAQPNACPVCGPRLWLADTSGMELEGDPVKEASALLSQGYVIAVKGLGGFHLACDATSDAAVEKLRARKRRYAKPLAVMVRDLEEAARLCWVDPEEAAVLASPKAPIVLLRARGKEAISPLVAEGLAHLGLFLPYTPLHHLLLQEAGIPLVMTSGNVSEEPIQTDNRRALEKLRGIADYFLLHDRDILVRYDDSVTRVFLGGEYLMRRARGYAPYPVPLRRRWKEEVLAVGGELKNTFCFLRGDRAFLGQHIGDMGPVETMEHFQEAVEGLRRLFGFRPRALACDLHPDYLTTHWATGSGMPWVGVQHHHAHAVSCMAENGLEGEVIGLVWDGTGYGTDGTSWGGEFLLCDEKEFIRAAHLQGYPMPGGDACVRDLLRMAAGVLSEAFPTGEAREIFQRLFAKEEGYTEILFRQIESGFNCPRAYGAGRLFDAAASILGVRYEAFYEGQAACELEATCSGRAHHMTCHLDMCGDVLLVDTRPLVRELVWGKLAKVPVPELAAGFHDALADAAVAACRELSHRHQVDRVVISGGVFQNLRLTERVVRGLERAKLQVFLHRKVPCNDGGISLGQAVSVAARLESGCPEGGFGSTSMADVSTPRVSRDVSKPASLEGTEAGLAVGGPFRNG